MKTQVIALMLILASWTIAVGQPKPKIAFERPDLPASGTVTNQFGLPVTFDLRPRFSELGLSIKDQSKEGTCEVFALVGALEYQLARRGTPTTLSVQFVRWAANKVSNAGGKRGNYSPSDLINGIKLYGVCANDWMPYDIRGNITPSKGALANASTRKKIDVTFFDRRSSVGDERRINYIRRVCQSIAGDCPVVMGSQFFGYHVDPKGFVSLHVGGRGHATILVGYAYDDKTQGGGFFILRNSWGSQWGNYGYAKCSFHDFERQGWTYIIKPAW